MEIVIAAILSVFVVFCIVMIVRTSRMRRAQKRITKKLKAQGAGNIVTAIHLNGLPVAEGIPCSIAIYQDRIEFQAGTTHINLDRKKITDMCIKTETEIQQQYVSSMGGAVGGAVLFGPIGAIIGGRAKKKTSKSISYFLIITYTGTNNVPAFIGFDVSACFFTANKIAAEFHKLNPSAEMRVDL